MTFRFLILSLMTIANAFGEIVYLKSQYSHIHQGLSPYSSSLTTIECGQALRVDRSFAHKEWLKVKAVGQTGYVIKSLTHKTRPECMQNKYPVFYEKLDLDLGEIYYWGKLSDLYISGKSKVSNE